MDIYKEFKLLSTKFQPITFNLGSLVRNDASSLTALRVVQGKIFFVIDTEDSLRTYALLLRTYSFTNSMAYWLN